MALQSAGNDPLWSQKNPSPHSSSAKWMNLYFPSEETVITFVWLHTAAFPFLWVCKKQQDASVSRTFCFYFFSNSWNGRASRARFTFPGDVQNHCLLACPWSLPQFLDSCSSPFKPAVWSVLAAQSVALDTYVDGTLPLNLQHNKGNQNAHKICASTATAPEGTSTLLRAAGISSAFRKKLALDTYILPAPNS